MYQQLFARLGFAWTVRITGFVTLALCTFAILAVSSNLSAPTLSAPWLDTKIFRDTSFMLVVVGSILICLGLFSCPLIDTCAHNSTGLFIPFFYIVDYSTAHGIAPQTAFYVLSVRNAGGILGRVAPSALSDSLSSRIKDAASRGLNASLANVSLLGSSIAGLNRGAGASPSEL